MAVDELMCGRTVKAREKEHNNCSNTEEVTGCGLYIKRKAQAVIIRILLLQHPTWREIGCTQDICREWLERHLNRAAIRVQSGCNQRFIVLLMNGMTVS